MERLRAAGCVFAEDEAALLQDAAGSPDELEQLVAQRVSGLPLEQILGWAEFCGLRIRLAPGVFVPRQRSRLLVDEALRRLHGGEIVLDLCCGSGAIGAAIAAARPDTEVYAADLDPAAVACARTNLPPDKVFQGDLFAALPVALRGRVDVIAVNAPYVPTGAIAWMPPEARVHEARIALDGGTDGLDLHRRIALAAPEWLAPGATLIIEVGRDQAPTSADLFATIGPTTTVSDDEVDGTVVVARLNRTGCAAPPG